MWKLDIYRGTNVDPYRKAFYLAYQFASCLYLLYKARKDPMGFNFKGFSLEKTTFGD